MKTVSAIFTVLLACFEVAVGKPSYLVAFQNQYQSSPLSRVASPQSCCICHSSCNSTRDPTGANANSYGQALHAASASVNIVAALLAVEKYESDQDSFDNRKEINCGTYPGDSNSKPARDPCDPEPPTIGPVTVLGPSGEQYRFTAAGPLSFQVTAADNLFVATVEFWVDGVRWNSQKGQSGTATYASIPSALGGYYNGVHRCVAKAYDAAGNVAISLPTTFLVSIPIVILTAPATGGVYTNAQPIRFQAQMIPDDGSTGVAFFKDYQSDFPLGTVAHRPFTFDWMPSSTDNGSRHISAGAAVGWSSDESYDSPGADLTIALETNPPEVTWLYTLRNPYSFGQTALIQVDAKDESGIRVVNFYKRRVQSLPGDPPNEDPPTELRASVTTPPYQCYWFIERSDLSSYWWAEAVDRAGNVSTTDKFGVDVLVPFSGNSHAELSSPLPSTITSAQTLTINVDASEDIRTVWVLDNGSIIETIEAPPFRFDWTRTADDNGWHTLSLEASTYGGSFVYSQPSTDVFVSIAPGTPAIALVSRAGDTIRTPQTITLEAQPAPGLPVAKVEFYTSIDGQPWSKTVRGVASGPPFLFQWTVTKTDNGPNVWTALAYDASGHPAFATPWSSPLRLVVDLDLTPPTVQISSPADQTIYTSVQPVSITANASDNVRVTSVEFFDSAQRFAKLTSPPFTINWQFSPLDSRTHVWTARAYDAVGNVSTSAPVRLAVNIPMQKPLLALVPPTPPDGTMFTAAQVVTLAAQASDPTGISRVEFSDNGLWRETVFTPPFLHYWKVPSGENGGHSWRVRAFNGLGDVSEFEFRNLQVQITSPDLLAEWRLAQFPGEALVDSSREATVWGDLADPDGDRRPNLLEYALGLNPLSAMDGGDSVSASLLEVAGAVYHTLAFKQRLDDPRLVYQVEVSSDLHNWVPVHNTIGSTPLDGNFDWVTVQDTEPIPPNGARFIRLRGVRN